MSIKDMAYYKNYILNNGLKDMPPEDINHLRLLLSNEKEQLAKNALRNEIIAGATLTGAYFGTAFSIMAKNNGQNTLGYITKFVTSVLLSVGIYKIREVGMTKSEEYETTFLLDKIQRTR
ncbi:MAG: hypothetical protein IKP07_06435 [Bacilli bacterium]|nr:hypothetical protein [Bacilli bacterium]